jgi:anti-sigma factor RsiW
MALHTHLRTEELLDYVDGRTDAATTERVRGHLAGGCAACARELQFWTRTLLAVCSDRAAQPPEWVRQRAFNLVLRQSPQRSLWERVLGALVSDSRQQAGLAGARDAGAAQFKLLFSAANRQIDLLCERGPGGWQVNGQVLAEEAPLHGWRVSATSDGHQEETRTDSLGEFTLRGLPSGSYEICLTELERELVLPNVQLID